MKVTQFKPFQKPTEIGENLFKIVLPQPFYEDNNVYLIRDRKEVVLIDSGYIESIPQLQGALKYLGTSLRGITKVIYTHNHIDHISSALVLKAYSPKVVFYGCRGMAEGVGNYIESVDLFRIATEDLIIKAYKNLKERRALLKRGRQYWKQFFSRFQETKKGHPILKIDIGVEQRDRIELENDSLEILHTPGHNLYHITPYLTKAKIYFSGDLIIANLTAIYSELDGDLAVYKRTLDYLSEMEILRMLPGHGPEVVDPQRSISLVKKTLGILERGVLRRLDQGPSDLFNLVEAAMGKKVHQGEHASIAFALMYSIIKKLEFEKTVYIRKYKSGYEKFYKEPYKRSPNRLK